MASDSGTEKKRVASCALHGRGKPQVCKDYPKLEQYIPPECTYTFNGAERRGECSCGIAACCNIPREGGEPGGTALPALAGGKPCKHLVWSETEAPIEKKASQDVPYALPDLQDLVGGPRDS